MDAGELVSLCDRVIVIREGRAHSEISGEITPERIVDAVYGNGNGEPS
jgi:ABC-type sugar transport system ATPase subunit